ncbi:replication licensing factor Cdt1, partial [Coemansia furcata]
MRGQKTTTIKDFARVSKNTDAPIGKNAPMRMTRSRSAAATAAAATQLAPEVVEPPVTRKRKLTDADASVAPVNKKKLQRIDDTATPTRRKKPTTISAYFSPIKSVAETNEPVVAPVAESVVTTAVEPVSEPAAEIAVETVIEPLAEPFVETVIETAVEPTAEFVAESVVETAVEPVVEPTQSNPRDKLNERAAVLLARLRDRKNVAAGTTAAETTAEETRTIQDDLRTRRAAAAAAAAAAPLPTQAVSTFAEAGGVSAPEQHQRDVHRQFVAIASPHGRALPRELRKLSEIFQALDHAVMFAGHTSVIYHRVRRAVESMAKRTFGWRELGQILALYPESYHHAPVPTTHEGRRVASLELTPRVGGMNLAVEIEARRDEFSRRLVARVDAAHRAFLAQRGYDASDIDATRGHWHPAFDVESTPK